MGKINDVVNNDRNDRARLDVDRRRDVDLLLQDRIGDRRDAATTATAAATADVDVLVASL
jgi:hypothetical protein